jgi:hypothetical protein
MRMHVDDEDVPVGFRVAWINDKDGLIHRARRAGYDHVTVAEIPSWGDRDVDSANPSSAVISMPVGQGVVAFLMKQPLEFYEEDRTAMDDLIDDREADMKKELNSGKDGSYGSVKIERKK